ncbi:MAG: hypothetical protein R2851_19655 [Caldilineaceae bacterium]
MHADLSVTTWLDANQQWLNAELARLRTRMEHLLAGADPVPASAPTPWTLPQPPALDDLAAAFALTPFERDLLLLCAGVEVDSRFGALCAALHDDPAAPWPTFALALHVCAAPSWESLAPGRPLRRWHLVELQRSAARPLTARAAAHRRAGAPPPHRPGPDLPLRRRTAGRAGDAADRCAGHARAVPRRPCAGTCCDGAGRRRRCPPAPHPPGRRG